MAMECKSGKVFHIMGLSDAGKQQLESCCTNI